MVEHRKAANEYQVGQKVATSFEVQESTIEERTDQDGGLIEEAALNVYSAQGFDLGRFDHDLDLAKIISPKIIEMYRVLPISRKQNVLKLAVAEKVNRDLIDDISSLTGMNIVPVLVDEKKLALAINTFLSMVNMKRERPQLVSAAGERPETRLKTDIRKIVMNTETPAVKVVNTILEQAVECLCSDIHIEPFADDIRVRFRLDGELYEVLVLPLKVLGTVVSRLKIMAAIDIAEKRLPQDGHLQMQINSRRVDFRVSTLPTINGEKVVLRILDRANALMTVDELGFSLAARNSLMNLCYRPHGMILVTGPTGSGKTTTLYSILEEINSGSKNILTIEDPVEYSLPGINQVQVNQKAGLTFAGGLRFILRQDPDIIMVGEIRDEETAELAVHAALTGHLVFSTLHTNNAAGALIRLLDMGLKQFLVANAVSGIIAQRLARRLCRYCCESYILDEKNALRMGIPEETGRRFYRARCCDKCRYSGYKGRIALQEIMVITKRVKNLIMAGVSLEEVITDLALAEGMFPIEKDAIEKARKGLISLEEAMKVVYARG